MAEVRRLFTGEGAALASMVITTSPDREQLTDAERAIYDNFTSDRRRAEWWSGRHTAHAALAEIGATGLSIIADERGVPLLIGEHADEYFISISHGRRMAAAAATRVDSACPFLGIDIVDVEDAPRVAKIGPRYLTPAEQAMIANDERAGVLAWGTREAIAKATSTGMFVFALKHGAIVDYNFAARRISAVLPGYEVSFDALADGGWVVIAAATPAARREARRIAHLDAPRG